MFLCVIFTQLPTFENIERKKAGGRDTKNHAPSAVFLAAICRFRGDASRCP
jgi:hypothetical protein